MNGVNNMGYHSIKDLVDLCKANKCELWQVIMRDNANEHMISEKQVFDNMKLMYAAMKKADNDYNKNLKSPSEMAGGDGELMHIYNKSGKNICGDFISTAMEKAIKMGESNACMKRIVAAPTAGSCGVIPAVFISYEKLYDVYEDDVVKALFIAAGIGAVIAENASIAGASGGCQAEIGSGSGMAAGAICYIKGGDTDQIGHACAMALKNLMGLVCDPVGGLVEVPCVKRNVGGAVNALAAADMALAGITSKVPVDQVIDAMKEVGDKMDVSLRETGVGGVAGTAAAQEVVEKLGM